jgi:pyridoxal phosphate enzyme (YggS family)
LSLARKAEISANLEMVKERIDKAAVKANRNLAEINLIAVTKTFPISDLLYLYELGVRDFGENRDQEASGKVLELPIDINWHFQGQIQSNKLKSITSWATYIHSVDQYKYAKMISDFSAGEVKSVFIQLSLDQVPDGRGGVAPADLHELAIQINKLPNLKLMGLMAVAPVDEDSDKAFTRLAKYQSEFIQNFPEAQSLSAGMSGDYESAISHGATHLRIGSSILGNR